MNRIAALAVAVCCATPALAQTSVGVSIGINQPGVYGRIDIGSFPQPAVVYAQPIVIAAPVTGMRPKPVYLYVPPGHQKNWAKHCGSYNACGQPVYFVQESWVRERYDEQQGKGKKGNNGNNGKQGKG